MRASGEWANEASMDDRKLKERCTRALLSEMFLGHAPERRRSRLVSVGIRRVVVDMVAATQWKAGVGYGRQRKI